ncbi:pyrroline-5-carboxylate reductase [Nitrogeniibacter mangrovi]|uniref:Pyrroline-5-carboxylate reductase n=1 Tax=Nitrogeniibacter mangrovi TaxID=2016596 RepID=A0A6C1B233_9RHOO|nr:pyrroline-5-carboxylate reductase [Nitrogeniibacter mangrovi]QID16888.1 pyrroline-5-carboxylate reductase [Nitrogeniibacter mangrovi]
MNIGFIGGGNMARALIGGMCAKGFAAADILVVEPRAEGQAALAADFGVHTRGAVDEALLGCDIIVLAVKPQQMRAAVAPLAGRLERQVVVSIAAGLRAADIGRWLGGYTRLVRCMPNTPALIGAGMTGLYADPVVSAAEREQVEAILTAVGRAVWIDDEAGMDAVTAISGSGPAYVFHFIEALEAAGRALGFDEATARTLAIGTVEGAARLAAQSDEAPAVLRERVTSKGGTTAAALAALAADDFAGIIARAVEAARARGQAMGDELGAD